MNSDPDRCSLWDTSLPECLFSTSDVLTSSKLWGLTSTRKGSPSAEAVVVYRIGSCHSIRCVNRTQISVIVINSYSLQYTSIVITFLVYVVFPEHGCKVSPSSSILWPELCVMLFWLNLRVPQQSVCFLNQGMEKVTPPQFVVNNIHHFSCIFTFFFFFYWTFGAIVFLLNTLQKCCK